MATRTFLTLVADLNALGVDFLDEAVEERKSLEATSINNGGAHAQVVYLGSKFVQELVRSAKGTL